MPVVSGVGAAPVSTEVASTDVGPPLGMSPVEWMTPEQLVERYPDGVAHAPGEVIPDAEGEPQAPILFVRASLLDSGPKPPTQPALDPLWIERLSKMAAAAGQTPTAYLETLLRRAWCSMPLEKRSG